MAIVFVVLSKFLWFAGESIVSFTGLLNIVGNIMFFFTSGYLIFLNNQINSFDDITLFLRKRLLRIFPLYWVSLSYCLHLNPSHSLFYAAAHFLGLQLVFTNFDVIILWFIGCITVFYLLYPLLVMKAQSNKTIIIRSLVVFFVLLAIRMNLEFFNASIFAFFPIFVFGILISKNKQLIHDNIIKVKNASLLVIPVCFYWYVVTKPPALSDSSQLIGTGLAGALSVHIPKVTFGISIMFLLYWIANNYIKGPNIKKIIKKCAMASYPVYLFHGLFVGFINSYLALIVGIPILFIIFYNVQTEYDKITSSIFSKIDVLSK